MFSDLKNICRLCLNQIGENSTNIFSLIDINLLEFQNDKKEKISDFIMEFTSIKLDDNKLPALICKICLEKVNDFFTFKLQCEFNDSKLKQFINNKNANEICIKNENRTNWLDNFNISYSDDLYTEELVENNTQKGSNKNWYEKKWHCKICNLSFSRTSSKLRHKKTKSHKDNLLKRNSGVGKRGRKSKQKSEILNEIRNDTEVKVEYDDSNCIDDNLQRKPDQTTFKYSCDVCEKKYVTLKKFRAHFDTHIILLRELQKYKFTQVELLQTNFVSLCLLCGEKFDSRQGFRDHVLIEHEAKTYLECVSCRGICLSFKEFLRHSFEKHKIYNNICMVCCRSFKSFETFQEHVDKVKNSSGYACSQCYFHADMHSSFIQHLFTHCSTINRCELCDITFDKRPLLTVHRRKFHRNQIKKDVPICSICGKNDFKTREKLSQHMRNHQINSEPAQCNICNKVLSSKDSLRHHLKLHLPIMPHACSFCGKKFNSSGNMRKHERIRHSDLRPYKCRVENCIKAFKRTDVRKVHERSHIVDVVFNPNIAPPITNVKWENVLT